MEMVNREKAITSVLGNRADEAISTGFMDTRFFRKQWNVPCVGYGPGDSGVGHTPDEYINIDQMVQVSQIFSLLMQEVIGA